MSDPVEHLLSKSNIAEQTVQPSPITASTALQPGEVLLKLSTFNLASNNLTYAKIGTIAKYWDYFPASSPEHGRVPVWAFADVVSSASPTVPTGARIWGYFPIATYIVLRLEAVPGSGGDLVETSAHRAGLIGLYQQYRLVETASARSTEEALAAVFKIQFNSGFAIAAHAAALGPATRGTVVLLSASAKTAFCTAAALRQQIPADAGLRILGLSSSAATAEYARETGYYDVVGTYDEAETLLADAPGPISIVDVAGRAETQERIQELAGDRLARTVLVGITSTAGGPSQKLRGDIVRYNLGAPQFLPTLVEEMGGAEAFNKKNGAAFEAFQADVRKKGLVTVVTRSGVQAVVDRWKQLLEGATPGREEIVFEL